MKQVKCKCYEDVKGFVSLVGTGKIMPSKFIITVTNDTHCTLSVVCESAPTVQYSIDITEIIKDLEI